MAIDYNINKLDHWQVTVGVHRRGMILEHFTSEQKCWNWVKKLAKESRWAVDYWMYAPAPESSKFHRSIGHGSYWPENKMSVDEFKGIPVEE